MCVIFTAISVAVMLFVMNVIMVSAFNIDIFSAIIHFTEDNFKVDFLASKEVPSEEIIQLFVTSNDSYGIIAECEKYGISSETPHCLPESYVLYDKSAGMQYFIHFCAYCRN